MEEHTCLHSEPAGKGRKKKKPLVLTLGSPLENGGEKKKKKKKNHGINLGQSAGKGREKKKKKNPSPDLGFQDLDFQDLDRRRKKKPWS
jgi:hypothetical protein